jgi:hypothetical protein
MTQTAHCRCPGCEQYMSFELSGELMAEGRSNQGIAERRVITERALQKHATSIFRKLGLAESSGDHRRVLAVLTFLNAWRRPARSESRTTEVRFAYLETPAGSIGARPAHGHHRVASRYSLFPEVCTFRPQTQGGRNESTS